MKIGLDIISIPTDKDYVSPLMKFLKKVKEILVLQLLAFYFIFFSIS